MRIRKVITLTLASVLMATSIPFMFTGCGKKSAGKSVEGKVSTNGSTSMEKVIGSLKETFEGANKGITVSYDPTGSGTGITAVLEGRCDIGLSSRNLKDDEKSKGLEETILAYDGIAVIVNTKNSVSDLTLDNIAKIYKGEIKNWKDVGGNDAEIVVIGREEGSGTRDGFESVTKTAGACVYSQALTSTGAVTTAVAGNSDAIGYISLASINNNIKVLKVNGVTPDEKTVRDGSYSIWRSFLLVTKKGTKLSDAATKFFNYVTSADAYEVIRKAGAIPVK